MFVSDFDQEGMSNEALAAFRRLEELTGGPFQVNSAYRSQEHNARVGGAKHSQHTHGNAFDINVAGMPHSERVDLINKAREAGFRGIGVYDNALHFDVGPQRAWGPSHSRDSLPGWYTAAFGGAGGSGAGTSGAAMASVAPRPAPMDKLARYNALAAMMPRYQFGQNVEDFLL